MGARFFNLAPINVHKIKKNQLVNQSKNYLFVWGMNMGYELHLKKDFFKILFITSENMTKQN